MSLGGAPSARRALDDAVQFAWNAGLVIVAGAGNDGNTSSVLPSSASTTSSLCGAFDEDHRRATFSNYGNWVDISAPGNVITCRRIRWMRAIAVDRARRYRVLQLAERHVDGDAACLGRRGARVVAQPT